MAKKKAVTVSHIVKPEGLSTETWQVLLRKQAARNGTFLISAIDEKHLPGEYRVRHPDQGTDYKVVYRGAHSPWNYCACLDFKTSALGTCKHLEAVKKWLQRGRKVHKEVPVYTSVYVDYQTERAVKVRIGSENETAYRRLAERYFDSRYVLREDAYAAFDTFLKEARRIDESFRCYDDARRLVVERRDSQRRAEIESRLTDDELDSLLTCKLFPYQKEGVRFCFKAGKAVIADEMGLGKTVQAIATAEMMRKCRMITSVLIVCPTSLKYQWKREIERFTNHATEVQVVEGSHLLRCKQYQTTAFYKIVSYNAMSNDVKMLGGLTADLLIMDEVQRLKNWSTKLAVAARRIVSPYAVVLSGTPLENKLEELYATIELVDQFRLAPYYRFKEKHILKEEATGRTVGYRHLNEIKQRIADVMIRRRKCDVRLQLPGRSDRTILVPMTRRQQLLHNEYKNMLAILIDKWQRFHFLSEADRLRLIKLLSQMRMVADSTYILDQKTRYDTKVGEVVDMVQTILDTPDEKVVIFSEWERMTRLVAAEFDRLGIAYSYLHGGVPSKQRKQLVDDFTDDDNVRVFLSTDAGATGLNLQAAATIINLDLPWNPARLEQRIARIYRFGGQAHVEVINLVSAGSLEEQMIGKLRFKSEVAKGALDDGEDSILLDDNRFKNIVSLAEDIIKQTEDETPVVTLDESEEGEEESRETSVPEEAAASTTPMAEDASREAHRSQPEQAAEDATREARREPSELTSEETSREPRPEQPEQTAEDASREARREQSEQGNQPKADGVQGSQGHSSPSPAASRDTDISRGLRFLSELSTAIRSEEGRTRLVDSLVQTDKQSGTSSIHIPVKDKQTVTNLLEALGKLLG